MDDEPDFGMGDDEGAPGEGDLGPPGPPPHRGGNSESGNDESFNEMSRPGILPYLLYLLTFVSLKCRYDQKKIWLGNI